jgi:hypothetical protein
MTAASGTANWHTQGISFLSFGSLHLAMCIQQVHICVLTCCDDLAPPKGAMPLPGKVKGLEMGGMKAAGKGHIGLT